MLVPKQKKLSSNNYNKKEKAAEAVGIPMGGDESEMSLYRVLADRCRSLEAAQDKLKEQLEEIVVNEEEKNVEEEIQRTTPLHNMPGFYLTGTPYKRILDMIGHAVFVYSASTGEITFWNPSAEKLYGWKDYEVLGQRITEVLISKDYYEPLKHIIEMLHSGETWSGQFPFTKRAGETFMALVTKSPLYEDDELAGVVCVSVGAELLNSSSENSKPSRDSANTQNRLRGSKLNKSFWRSQIAPVPQLSSSVSNLASRVLSGSSGHDTNNACEGARERDNSATKAEDNKPEKANTLAAKIFAKLHINGVGDCRNEGNNTVEHTENNTSAITEVGCGQSSSRINCNYYDAEGMQDDEVDPKVLGIEDDMPQNPDFKQLTRSGSSGTQGSSPTKGDNETNPISDCEIRWEDLHIGEEIGQGAFAVVHRGVWNGSDVAIKVYFGNEYNEGTLQDYKKEIDIMRRLRHPNVLLFMGAVYSNERLAIVTEFLPRGSLFRTLHNNNQMMDRKRRLRMALDVARGMNYLHHRNPPIVHRDLKSSNLLVDKSWNVKVGDFGLSKLKEATLLHTKSGRGTPQWMAPEVLRNEPSNEKSDVFSFGVVLWELMTESVPWSDLNSLQIVGVVGFMDRRLEIPERLDPQIASIIRDCWRSEPEHRPSFEDIIPRVTSLVNRMTVVSTRKSLNP